MQEKEIENTYGETWQLAASVRGSQDEVLQVRASVAVTRVECGSRLSTAEVALHLECCRDVGTLPIAIQKAFLPRHARCFTKPMALVVWLV